MAVNIPRTFVFTDGYKYRPSMLESEFSNIVNIINNANAGILGWTVVKTSGLQLSTTVVTSGASYQALSTDAVVVVNKGTGSATTVTLPASPSTGQVIFIKDGKGDAATNNITVTPSSGNIDGSANYAMNVNFRGLIALYNGSQWNKIAIF